MFITQAGFDRRMLLVNSADGSGDSDDGFGDFVDSLGGGSSSSKEQPDDQVDELESEETEEIDEDSDDEDSDEPADDDAPADPRDQMLKQQQEIIDKLMDKVEKLGQKEETPAEEPVDLDPFESNEFKDMAEVMNWDADEAAAFKTFFNKYMTHNAERLTSQLMKTVPEKVSSSVSQQQKIQATRDKFYSDNPELAGVKPFVAELAKSVAAELGEGVELEAILDEVGKRAYKVLGLTKMKQPAKDKKKPAFAGAKGARQKKAGVDPKQKEIDAVIGIL